ncbi:MAG: hypothetical protein NUV31_10525, partial [Dehalococcoidales bacterium]|nr:hypothetical protein [Dehalococcoidales bacterium]
AGCTHTDKIGDILADPLKYEGKTVHIAGYVGNTVWFSALTRGAYELGDGTGKTIWVVTSQPPPSNGAKISVSGTVSTAFKLGDRTFGTVVDETERK